MLVHSLLFDVILQSQYDWRHMQVSTTVLSHPCRPDPKGINNKSRSNNINNRSWKFPPRYNRRSQERRPQVFFRSLLRSLCFVIDSTLHRNGIYSAEEDEEDALGNAHDTYELGLDHLHGYSNAHS